MKLQTSGSCLGAVRLTSNLSLCRPCVYPSIYILDFPGGNLPKDELSTTQLWIWDKLKVWDIIFFLSRNPMSLHFLGGHLCFCLFGRTVQVCRSLFVPSSVSVSCLLFLCVSFYSSPWKFLVPCVFSSPVFAVVLSSLHVSVFLSRCRRCGPGKATMRLCGR